MNNEVGGRGPKLTKPLLKEIQSLDHRDKKKEQEARVKRGMIHTVCAGDFFELWLGRARFVSTRYLVASVLRSQQRRRLFGCR